MNGAAPALSIVVPLYNSAETLPMLVRELAALQIEGGHELVLVNDGSRDNTEAVALSLLDSCPVPLKFISHSRNFGEHNAVLAGLRETSGDYVINMDDDLQNPPSEVLKLLEIARREQRDVVYSAYEHKEHAGWRNLGSRLTNVIADWSVDKPPGLYLSSFRCISRFVADQISRSANPYPYIDGLIFQVTQNVGVVTVRHAPRASGQSGYTMRRLLRLWMSMLINTSIMPLRVATVLGLAMSGVGFAAVVAVLVNHVVSNEPLGWGSLMAALLVFSGTQLLLLGAMGEYVGRVYLGVSGKPQSIVRRRIDNSAASEGAKSI
jgi:undecaprenyl-phosphate 4-deoxy-4-formamido-L-arabinose transferase